MRIALLSSLVLLSVACIEDVGKGKHAATVQDVPTQDAAAKTNPDAMADTDAKAGESLTLPVDVSKSSINALGAKITAKHPITFKDFSGSVTLTEDTVTGVQFEVTMATLEADQPKLTEHLLTPDFFDAAKYPTSTFKSTGISEGSNAPNMTHTVTGDLTVHGVTKRISFPAVIQVKPKQVTANSEFSINRQDFKITYPGRPDDLIQDNVVLTIKLVAKKAAVEAAVETKDMPEKDAPH